MTPTMITTTVWYRQSQHNPANPPLHHCCITPWRRLSTESIPADGTPELDDHAIILLFADPPPLFQSFSPSSSPSADSRGRVTVKYSISTEGSGCAAAHPSKSFRKLGYLHPIPTSFPTIVHHAFYTYHGSSRRGDKIRSAVDYFANHLGEVYPHEVLSSYVK